MVVGDVIFIPVNVFNNLNVSVEAPISVVVGNNSISWLANDMV
jgi:hypothetical protein